MEHGGYRVTRLGIEELFGEIKYLSLNDYLSLKLPKNLRSLPDFLVATRDVSKAFLVEVKFRKDFSLRSAENLYMELKKQRKYWPESYAIIMRADAGSPDLKFHQDYIRAVPPGDEEKLIGFKNTKYSHLDEEQKLKEVWDALPTILKPFDQLIDAEICKGMDSITTTLKNLAKIT